jgi:hypothetical protein
MNTTLISADGRGLVLIVGLLILDIVGFKVNASPPLLATPQSSRWKLRHGISYIAPPCLRTLTQASEDGTSISLAAVALTLAPFTMSQCRSVYRRTFLYPSGG